MERGLVGRVSLSIAAAREQHRAQGGSYAKLVAVNFLSKERREGSFAAANQRDRGGAVRAAEPGAGRQAGTAEGRAGLGDGPSAGAVQRGSRGAGYPAGGELGKIREAWKQVGREKTPERGREVAEGRGHEAEAMKGSRFGWLDRQAAERSVPARGAVKPRHQTEQAQDNKKASRFEWLNQQKDPSTKVRERDDFAERRPGGDQSDRDR